MQQTLGTLKLIIKVDNRIHDHNKCVYIEKNKAILRRRERESNKAEQILFIE